MQCRWTGRPVTPGRLVATGSPGRSSRTPSLANAPPSTCRQTRARHDWPTSLRWPECVCRPSTGRHGVTDSAARRSFTQVRPLITEVVLCFPRNSRTSLNSHVTSSVMLLLMIQASFSCKKLNKTIYMSQIYVHRFFFSPSIKTSACFLLSLLFRCASIRLPVVATLNFQCTFTKHGGAIAKRMLTFTHNFPSPSPISPPLPGCNPAVMCGLAYWVLTWKPQTLTRSLGLNGNLLTPPSCYIGDYLLPLLHYSLIWFTPAANVFSFGLKTQ